MVDLTGFSPWLCARPEVRTDGVAARIRLGKRRVQSVLDTHTVANQKTLEQKISDQGPGDLRVDPHLLGLAIRDLREQRRLAIHTHPSTATLQWFSNLATSSARAQAKLSTIAPLYAETTSDGFGNLIGDALEIAVYKCLLEVEREKPRYSFQGKFDLSGPKNNQNRYNKSDPPKTVSNNTTTKQADFLQFGYDQGHVCIECKNYREWIYPNSKTIKDTIVKSYELGSIPLLVARRIHYSTFSNLLKPSGIIGHQTLFQYYPADKADFAAQIKHKDGIGFSDVMATETPHRLTREFFRDHLPEVVSVAAIRWARTKELLYEYATDQVDLSTVYLALKDI